MLCQVNDKLCTMVRDHWARYLMLKHIALASTMEKLVLFLWSFLIHGGSFKGLLHPRRDSFGKKMYLYVLQKIKITYIICWKLTLSYKSAAGTTLEDSLLTQGDLVCDAYKYSPRKLGFESVKTDQNLVTCSALCHFRSYEWYKHSFQSSYLWGILDLTKTNS